MGKKCDICGSTPTRGEFPNLVLCPECTKAFTNFECPEGTVTHKQPAAHTKQEMMERIDTTRPDWHKWVYGGGSK